MPSYLIQASYTAQGVSGLVRSPEDRAAALRPLVEGMGGRIETIYYAFGDFDVILIVDLPDTDPVACERVAGFWRALGSEVLFRNPQMHDEQVGWISHVPHLLAFAFAGAMADAPRGASELAGAGLRDFTRIARSDPEMWAEILSVNRKALAAPLEAFGKSLARIARAAEEGDADLLEQLLSRARSALSSTGTAPADDTTVTSGGDDPEPTAVPVRDGHSRRV